MNEEILERAYQESLEERLIAYLARTCDFSYEKAMNVYYNSKLSNKIYLGKDGIQYLDYKVLVQILLETEKQLLEGDW
ncbi:hypothetical protein [Hominifimenecus sp. rT4P-3]|uniref:hypothetical protein n=1 Tax=Hominifimenecus sp. rT4P-3 TaxID=3242979 RepID=UPI003DA333B6